MNENYIGEAWNFYVETRRNLEEPYQRSISNPYKARTGNDVKSYEYTEITKYDNHGTPSKYMRTTMTFDDGKVTSAEAPIEEANQYVGFIVCAAKHAYGNDNTISDMADYWLVNKPKIDARKEAVKEKAKQQKAEEERIRTKKIEKKRIYRAAKARKEAYEAAKLAEEKYGVPANWENK